jgi:Holliday junction resolvase RusA-like endonuclease
MTPITFFVSGEPKAQPRPKAFARKFGDKWMARVYDSGTAEHWKSQIAIAAKPFLPLAPLIGPLELHLTFQFPRLKHHFGSGKKADALKNGAPYFHASRPDFDNLAKAVCDALTQLGMWRDDNQIADCRIVKAYGPHQGCAVKIIPLVDVVTVERAQERELAL